MLHASVQREDLVVAAQGLLKGGFYTACVHADGLCTTTKMSTHCAKNLVLAFPPAYGRAILEELVFQIVSKP